MDVVRHNCEAVELEAVFAAMLEESVAMKSSALAVRWKWRCCWKVEMVMAYVLCFWRIVAMEGKHTPGAKAPILWLGERGPSLKAWRT
jgi:hypothetical protein